jgi:hypothetical protein
MHKGQCSGLSERRVTSALTSDKIVERRAVIEDKSVPVMVLNSNAKTSRERGDISLKQDAKLLSVGVVIGDQRSLCSGVYGEPK